MSLYTPLRSWTTSSTTGVIGTLRTRTDALVHAFNSMHVRTIPEIVVPERPPQIVNDLQRATDDLAAVRKRRAEAAAAVEAAKAGKENSVGCNFHWICSCCLVAWLPGVVVWVCWPGGWMLCGLVGRLASRYFECTGVLISRGSPIQTKLFWSYIRGSLWVAHPSIHHPYIQSST